MSALLIHAVGPTGHRQRFWYDAQDASLRFEDGTPVPVQPLGPTHKPKNIPAAKVSASTPGKKGKLRTVKIQLGLNCNYDCGYCNQRFVERPENTDKDDVQSFLSQLPTWLKPADDGALCFEFWGGEPLVYWKTLQPLAEDLRARYPQATFSIITNGSLLTREKNAWLEAMGFQVAISHDGPGQHVRGPDPLEDPVARDAIMDLFTRLSAQGRFSFNTMLNRENYNRGAIQEFFNELTGSENVVVGEGLFVDAYDEGGLALSLQNEAEHFEARAAMYSDVAQGKAQGFSTVREKIVEQVNAIAMGRSAKGLGQKCGMDNSDSIAVDLRGNVLTCQNVSDVAMAPNGNSHKIGHVSEFDKIELDTSTHWAFRKDCSTCPVLQTCKGGCMFLGDDDKWAKTCENSYSTNIVFFVAAFEYITHGYRPVFIEGALPHHRADIWGIATAERQALGNMPEPMFPEVKKPFPIPVVSAEAAPASIAQQPEGEVK